MSKPAYRFYRGEKENPFDYERDPSRHTFWEWEAAADEQDVDGDDWYDRFGGSASDFIKNWNATNEEKGRLLWMYDMCGKWNPYACDDTDWTLYTKSATSE